MGSKFETYKQTHCGKRTEDTTNFSDGEVTRSRINGWYGDCGTQTKSENSYFQCKTCY